MRSLPVDGCLHLWSIHCVFHGFAEPGFCQIKSLGERCSTELWVSPQSRMVTSAPRAGSKPSHSAAAGAR